MILAHPGQIRPDMEFICRLQPTTDEAAPWEGIFFKFPVDSDDLSEGLKSAYPSPQCRTLRERKHQAAIDFLQAELHRMRKRESAAQVANIVADLPSPNAGQGAENPYVELSSDHSRSQSSCSGTSPSFSEPLNSPGLVERAKSATNAGASPRWPGPTTPSTNAQQFVWSAHDGRNMRQKTKRKMTMEERSQYKETRKRGACEKCRKQKGRVYFVISYL